MSRSTPTYVLGLSAYYHDSAACLLRDGEILAAAQEERFTRKKGDAGFPARAVEYCLEAAGIEVHQLDYVGFYDKPLLKFERILETYLAVAPRGFGQFLRAGPLWIKEKLYTDRELRAALGGYEGELLYAEHHESHAASAFYPSPFERSAVLTIDGVGEWATASIGVGDGSELAILKELRWPDSLGLLYSAFTYYAGFKVNSGEYKVMGLAPYGEPRYVELIYRELINLAEDGSFRLNQRYFDYLSGLTMTSPAFHQLFGGPPREPESMLTQKEMDLARSVQVVCEEIMLRMARTAHRESGGLENLCLAGGVALNCVGNGRLLREGPFKRLWIQPAAGDAGGALGVAELIWHRHLSEPRKLARRATAAPAAASRSARAVAVMERGPRVATALVTPRFDTASDVATVAQRSVVAVMEPQASPLANGNGAEAEGANPPNGHDVEYADGMRGSYLGPEYSPEEIEEFLRSTGAVYQRHEREDLLERVAELLATEHVVGFLSGRMEFGPRALGARSILGDPRSSRMQAQMNLKIKFRESFRPFAPSVLRERVSDYFALDCDSPYMLLVASVQPERQIAMTDAEQRLWGIEQLNVVRSDIPAVTHIDYSARIQTVDRETNAVYYDLIRAFERRTGCGVLVNTSFNVRGEPIVCTPADAYRCFMRTHIDHLVLWPFLLDKSRQPEWKETGDWRTEFQLD
ncbi:MAG: carbamoyltransferase [Gemmatimonadota bacterium]|nr:carbamoyltransferase [Gemmatimonadota bacterium]